MFYRFFKNLHYFLFSPRFRQMWLQKIILRTIQKSLRFNTRHNPNIILRSYHKIIIYNPVIPTTNHTRRMQSHNLIFLHSLIIIRLLLISHLHKIPSKQSSSQSFRQFPLIPNHIKP